MTHISSEAESVDIILVNSKSETDLEGSLFQLPIRRRQTQATINLKNIEDVKLLDSGLGGTGIQERSHVLRAPDSTAEGTGPDPSQPEDQLRLTDVAFERLACADTEKLAACLDAGALIEHENHDGLTLLVLAINNSNVVITRLLLQKGADVHHRAQRKPPLFHAVQNPEHGPVLIRLLLDYGANINTTCGTQGMNALHWAAAAGMVDSADYLLSRGIDIEATCAGEHTALHVAAGTGHLTVVKLLLAQGAELAKRGELGGSAITFAASMGHLDVVKLCTAEGLPAANCDDKGLTALICACELGRTSVVEYLLEKCADVNKADTRQSTPALEAAAKGHTETFHTLLNHGADLSISNAKGENSLGIAMSKGHRDIVRLILTSLGGPGYPLESVSLQIASAKRLETIRSLMKNASMMYANVPESKSLQNGAWVKWVLDTGGDLVRPQALSNMVLVAIADADVDLIRTLLSVGADPNDFSLSTAVVNRNLDVVRLLLGSGAGPAASPRCIKRADGRPDNALLDVLLNMPYQKDICLATLQALLDSGRFNILTGSSSSQTAFWRVLESEDWGPELQTQVAFIMLESVTDINYACSGDGGTLIHHATRYGRKDIVGYLLEKGANINAQDNAGRSPFILACEYQANMILFLRERGADLDLRYEDGRGPLHAAAIVGNIRALELLWTQESIVQGLDECSRDGWTPLACALGADQEEAASFLIERGANLKHIVATNGRSMLHLAAAFGHERVFEQILRLGDVDVDAKDAVNHSTPLLLACAGTRYKSGSTKIVRALLAAGADIEWAASHLDRPLHVAITTGNTQIAHILVEHGADITATGDKDRTPLHLTAEHSNSGFMRLLLRRGAATEATDDSGWTPLHLCNRPDEAQILIDHGADVDCVDKKGLTPLHHAILYGDLGLFMMLRRYGASTHTRGKNDGRNAMDIIEDMTDIRLRDEFLASVNRNAKDR
ncbi:ankyrin repeat-containing domain protein [Boeremia exigua]|uniref:ankyrin repeat-containing domain protein n=1 Tax=Boeremia exigua TaxID=749465 RepID=UPI001E8D639E|nr:ankyrin repeat-containing domain protein [Boeremia exigua]KAH6615056.1 ankyrin repeat-containing domain protein [Boeremia exigua]